MTFGRPMAWGTTNEAAAAGTVIDCCCPLITLVCFRCRLLSVKLTACYGPIQATKTVMKWNFLQLQTVYYVSLAVSRIFGRKSKAITFIVK